MRRSKLLAYGALGLVVGAILLCVVQVVSLLSYSESEGDYDSIPRGVRREYSLMRMVVRYGGR